MVKNVKISVISPSYNQGQFIEDAIKSVIDQKYTNFEHIIIDAGSTDNTLDILKKYPHLIWVSEKDDGQSDAINKGVLKATGDWILWLNVDDLILPHTFENFLRAVSKYPNVDYVYGHTVFVNEALKPIKTVFHVPYHYFYTLWRMYIPPSTGSFIRAAFFKENLLDVNYHMVMDTEWVLRCGSKMRAKLVNSVFSAFRVSENNKTAEQIKNNVVSPRHAAEREAYHAKHIKSKYLFSDDTLPKVLLRNTLKIPIKGLLYLNKTLFTLININGRSKTPF